jgi:hypothetical protein
MRTRLLLTVGKEEARSGWLLCFLFIYSGLHLAVAEANTICQNTEYKENCADCCVAMSRDEAIWQVLGYCKREQSELNVPFYLDDSRSGTSVTFPAKVMERVCKDAQKEKPAKESVDDCLKVCRSKAKKPK